MLFQLGMDSRFHREQFGERKVSEPTIVDSLKDYNICKTSSGLHDTICLDFEGRLFGFGRGQQLIEYISFFVCFASRIAPSNSKRGPTQVRKKTRSQKNKPK